LTTPTLSYTALHSSDYANPRSRHWCGEPEVDVLRLTGIFENFSKLASASRKWRVGKLADSCDGGMFNARVIPGTMECFRILPFDL
jgi:hypothetical protein